MADAADVVWVQDNIEPDYTDKGWSEQQIIDRLDSGSIKERVIAAYWAMRASAVIELVNTSESGSSRSLDSLYPRYRSLADTWDAAAKAIESPVTAETAARGRLGSFAIKRV